MVQRSLSEASQFIFELLGELGIGPIDGPPEADVSRLIETSKYEFGRLPRRLMTSEGDDRAPAVSVQLFSDWYERLAQLEPLAPEEVERLAQVLDQYRVPNWEEAHQGAVFDLSSDLARESFDRFFAHNLRLVRIWALRLAGRFHPLDLDDLFQAGCIGLHRAIELWDWRRGYLFSTYAVNWIKQSIHREACNTFLAVRLPVYRVDEVRRDRETGAWFRQDGGGPVDLSITGDHWPLAGLLSLDDLLEADVLEDLGAESLALPSHEERIAWDDVLTRVDQLLSSYDEGKQRILRGRLDVGLEDDDLTLQELGALLGVTRERIRQRESELKPVFLGAARQILEGTLNSIDDHIPARLDDLSTSEVENAPTGKPKKKGSKKRK